MPRETVGKTFFVAFAVCVVFSVLVSSAAVYLRPVQELNKLLDKQRNILSAAGLIEEGGVIDKAFIDGAFAGIEARLVDLQTGEYVAGVDPATFDPREAARDPSRSVAIPTAEDLAGIKRRATQAAVYLVRDGDRVTKVILPIYGKGLWSTMYGFIALDARDVSTIRGLVFYEHGETPGLGGEVENPRWQALWNGKRAFGEGGDLRISIIKGQVDVSRPGAEYQVDGLSGATITSRGVHGTLHYWLSDGGFGPYIERLRARPASST